MESIVIATGNPHKVNELLPLLQPLARNFHLQTDFFCDEAVEDGDTYLENALKKARYASAKTGLPAIADDSGLSVDALQGEPGIYSARYADKFGTSKPSESQNRQHLLAALQGLPYAQRKAHYYCAVVLVRHPKDPAPIVGMGRWNGEILMEERTPYGIGYDSFFWDRDRFRVAADIPLEVKNEISARAQAARSVVAQWLQDKALRG
ncbi:non-canonical purine NTP pyrophosphatase [Thiosulfatimonas sediminis]|uniref:dITP/XTP pyrophosphatase n=1 Tax=Thiosulfatimonas sediminis TaxID=2675054 RepID=A0A6F8PYI7_9GAMM|nr:RdgB/HAM1 family non-canonical purine NTP pyrophosphatase [Thiosulfatimonas sediminis]BBP47058.1 non-canonical purine NTP pyrophosphatase [Thiosulfatimonas sediminis]